jgi:hypothetical protein
MPKYTVKTKDGKTKMFNGSTFTISNDSFKLWPLSEVSDEGPLLNIPLDNLQSVEQFLD